MHMRIGQVLGIKTAGDRLHTAERAVTRQVRNQECKKKEAANLARDAKMAEYFRSKGVPDDIISGGLALK